MQEQTGFEESSQETNPSEERFHPRSRRSVHPRKTLRGRSKQRTEQPLSGLSVAPLVVHDLADAIEDLLVVRLHLDGVGALAEHQE